MTIAVRAPAETPARAWRRALEMTSRACADPGRILPRALAEWAERYGDAPALIAANDGDTLSFAELAARVNRVSRHAIARGVGKGEAVALVMGNRPDYVALWLGLTQIGAVVALVNVNLAGAGLAHSLAVAEAQRVIVDDGHSDAYETARVAGAPLREVWRYRADGSGLGADIAARDGAPLTASERRAVTLGDPALYIYTSGTTGLPKAAHVSHRRVVEWSHWFAGLADLGPDDRMYDCLPMYHSVGGVAAIGAPLVNGGAAVIAERFSARGFWDDVTRHGCTAFQYVGELCRYLVNAPPNPAEGAARLRLACGNGMGAEVWRAFAARFPRTRVLEFYAATEGNFSLYNVEGRVGAIGRLPAFQAMRDPIALVAFDHAAQAPRRGADGRCIRCAPGEVGEAIGRIGADATSRFEGYRDATATQEKILRDVFTPGDAWARSGDLMRRDADGFFYFVDRVGDTFRWKGENVATLEVAAALSGAPGVRHAVVYGVEVPGMEGRAGMAALEVDARFDLDAFARLAATLPRYARPAFLRVSQALELTSTFKSRGRALADEGFDPARIADALLVFDRARDAYRPLDAALHASIRDGAFSL